MYIVGIIIILLVILVSIVYRLGRKMRLHMRFAGTEVMNELHWDDPRTVVRVKELGEDFNNDRHHKIVVEDVRNLDEFWHAWDKWSAYRRAMRLCIVLIVIDVIALFLNL